MDDRLAISVSVFWTRLQVKVGTTVGYSIRFEDITSNETIIKCTRARSLWPAG